MGHAEKPSKRVISPWVSLVAGGTAGGVEAASTYPFEFAKTRMQLQVQGGTVATTNPFRLISQVVRQEGVRSLYTGCSTLIVGTTAKAAIRFLSFDTIRNALSDEQGKLSASRGILAGMVAGAVESATVVTPTERVKTALQLTPLRCRIDDAKVAHRFHSGLHASQTLVKESGVSELFRGLISTTLKQSATSAVRMGTYNILKETVKSYGISPSVPVTFGTGAMAGVVTVYATQPFDTIKTRAQGARGVGIGEATRSVIQDYGFSGFWKGSSMRLGRLLLSGGIVFSVYEQVASFLGAMQR